MRNSPPDAITPRHVLPVLLLLAVQVGLYIWMAPRGFEFTDESYYFHNYLYWREFTGNVTFFGAYFEWPFRALGASIAAMRVLSLLLLLASAALLMRQVMVFSWGDRYRAGSVKQGLLYMFGPMAAAMLYFGYLATLRAPSYNLLCLAAMAMMTACMLSVMERRRVGRRTSTVAFLYGVALGTCFLSKATSAALLAALHLVFFVALNRDWDRKWLLELVACVTAGFALNFLLLTLLHPGWFDILREGLALAAVRDGAYSTWFVVNAVRWELQNLVPAVGPWLLGAALLLYLVRGRIAAASRPALSLLIVLMVAAIPFSHVYQYRSRIWLIVTAGVAAALWAVERLARRGQPAGYDERRELAIMVLLMLSPVAFSFGTNMPVLAHSAIASLFAFIAVFLRLYRLADARSVSSVALASAFALLSVPALATQWLAFTDRDYTYRQAAPLALQNTSVVLDTGESAVRVDRNIAGSLLRMQEMVRQAGMLAGQDMIDLTGDGPGVIYAIGARPLGSPWMLGGYPGSAAAVERVIQKVDTERVRAAWLITSTDNPRLISNWRGIMERKLGPGTHRLVGSIEIVNPHAVVKGEPATVNLQLWKPTGKPASVGAAAALSRH